MKSEERRVKNSIVKASHFYKHMNSSLFVLHSSFFTLHSSLFVLHSSLFTLHLNNLLHPHIMVFGRNRFAFLKIEAHTYFIYIRVL